MIQTENPHQKMNDPGEKQSELPLRKSVLRSAFVPDLLRNYTLLKDGPLRELFDLAEPCDLGNPDAWVSLELYGRMCAWLEKNIGPASLKASGERTGKRIFNELSAHGRLSSDAGPVDALRAWVHETKALFRDPDNRGWVLQESGAREAVIRCNLRVHPVLQLGIFHGLVSQTGVRFPQVERTSHGTASGESGREAEEFKVTWFPRT